MKENELNIPGLKHQPVLFEIPEGYEEQLTDKLLAMTLSKQPSSESKGKKILIYVAVSSLAASVLLAVWLIGSSYFTSGSPMLTENSWTAEDEWAEAFSSGGEYEIQDEDFVQLTFMLIEEQESAIRLNSIESWFLEEGVDEEDVVEVLSLEV
jgi:hypothetical protein